MSYNGAVLRLLVIALVACSSPAKPPQPPGNVGVPGKPSEPAVVVQLLYRGTFFIGPPFSSLPPFTLLDDGTLITADDKTPVATTKLSRDEVAAIVQRVRDLGFDKLENHPEHCKKNPSNNTSVCTSDGAYTIVRVLRDGKLAEIATYEDHSNEPKILSAIIDYLVHHKHPATTPYRPTVAVMHVEGEDVQMPTSCRAIDPAVLHASADSRIWGIKLEGRELDVILASAPSNIGRWVACANGKAFKLTLVPGIPGSDLQSELDIYKPRKRE